MASPSITHLQVRRVRKKSRPMARTIHLHNNVGTTRRGGRTIDNSQVTLGVFDVILKLGPATERDVTIWAVVFLCDTVGDVELL
jgi:hypothetical protein